MVARYLEISVGANRSSWAAEWKGLFNKRGFTDAKQASADLTTAAWWAQIEETEHAYTEWQRALLLIAAAEAGEVDITAFEMAAADADHLKRVMREATGRWYAARNDRAAPALDNLLVALSVELYRRRLEEQHRVVRCLHVTAETIARWTHCPATGVR